MKNIYNTDATRTMTVNGKDGQPISIPPFSMKQCSDEDSAMFVKLYPKVQVVECSPDDVEPWELKILPSLPQAMRDKIKFNPVINTVGASTPDVVEPPVPIDDDRLGKPSNIHVCPMGCGYSSLKIKAVRMHQLNCKPATIE